MLVGWSLFFFGLAKFQTVASERPAYHLWVPVLSQPYRIGSCCHWYGERPITKLSFTQMQVPER